MSFQSYWLGELQKAEELLRESIVSVEANLQLPQTNESTKLLNGAKGRLMADIWASAIVIAATEKFLEEQQNEVLNTALNQNLETVRNLLARARLLLEKIGSPFDQS